MDYLDFELRIEKRGEEYQATVVRSPAGEASHTFDWPFREHELERYVLEMGAALGVARRDVRRIRTREIGRAREIGGKLFEAIFRNDVRASFVSSLSEARDQGQGLRLKLRVEAQELVSVPWEYLYDRSLGRFLCLREETPVVRYIGMRERVIPLRVEPPLSILFMASCPRDYRRVDVEGERANLEQAMGDLAERGVVTMTWMENATLQSLGDHLLRGNYHVFHYIGHATFSEDTGDGLLALEDEEGRGRLVSGERLAYLLGNHSSLRLVFLNACEGARTSQDDPFAGIAPTLIRTGGIPAVVAMQFSITDDAAITFGRSFYAALSMARPVDAAVIQGRMAMFTGGDDVEWGKPVLYMRAPDGILFDLQEIGEGERAEVRLARLYARAEELLSAESWSEAIARCEEIVAIDADYRDVGDLLVRAREELARQEQGERLALLYDDAMKAVGRHDRQEAIDKLEQVVDLDDGYRDAVAQLTVAREGLAKAEAERQRQEELAALYDQAVAAMDAKHWQESIDKLKLIVTAEEGYKDAAGRLAVARKAWAEGQSREKLEGLYERVVAAVRSLPGSAATIGGTGLIVVLFVIVLIVRPWRWLLAARPAGTPMPSHISAALVTPTSTRAPIPPTAPAAPTRMPTLTPMPTHTGTSTPAPTEAAMATVPPTVTHSPVPPTNTPTPVATSTNTATTRPTNTPIPPTATPTPVPPTPTSTWPVAGGTRVREKDSAVMVFVPPGEFLMGSPEGEGDDDEHPQHTVYVDDFWIDQTEVTNAQYRRCVDAGACRATAYADADRFKGADKPVVGVDWYDAQAYCKWLGEGTDWEFRLPSEAEWEKAARGTDGWEYPWEGVFDGRNLNFCDVNCGMDWKDGDVDDGYQYTAPAGSYPAGASPYGALDMAGNVWEWCSTLYTDYPYNAQDGREDLEAGGGRVLRGGSWDARRYARCACRNRILPDFRGGSVGFRVVASPDSP